MTEASSSEKRAISGDVHSDNPYSRLVALQRMGVVERYEAIREKKVLIVGVGGVGSVVADMLTRCGVGTIICYDYDKVELANMNRLFFVPSQAGMTKVDATRATLEAINPDVVVIPRHGDITVGEGYDALEGDIRAGVDVVLCCVDNYNARLTVNHLCLLHRQLWLESGVAENAVSGHIQMMIPGVSPCYECCPPLVVATGMGEPKRDGTCAASLPTTMGIVAGFLAQHTLKLLLDFGTLSPYVGYDAVRDHFPMVEMRPNGECRNVKCVEAQKEHAERVAAMGDAAHPLHARHHRRAAAEAAADDAARQRAAATAEAWGIAVVGGGDAADVAVTNAAGGVEFAFAPGTERVEGSAVEKTEQAVDLDELRARLQALR